MQPTALFALSFVTALSGAVAPGPVLFATLRYSAERGRWAGPLVVAGHAVVEVPLMAAIVLGLARLLRTPAFSGAVGLAGGAVLLTMGAFTLRGIPALTLPAATRPDAGARRLGLVRIVGVGSLTSIANPYFPLWWATVGLSLLTLAAPHGLGGYAVFYCGHILGDLAWYWSVSEATHRGRRLMSDRAFRWIVGTCAVLLVLFGLFFGWSGYRFLTGRAALSG